MTTKEILDRVLCFILELTQFHAELSQELPNLRIVVDNTRDYSDLKKTLARLFPFLAQRRKSTTILPPNCGRAQTKTAARLTLRRRLKMNLEGF